MTLDIPVIDAHQHFARLSLGYPWLAADAPTDRYHGDDRTLRRDYLIEDYAADRADLPIVGSVHVENGAADPVAEARWIGELIARHAPFPSVHVARADLTAPDAATRLEELAGMSHVRGIRHILNWHPDTRFTHVSRPGISGEPQWRRNFALLTRLGLSFDLQVFADQLPEAAALAGAHPDTTIILDHAGMPIGRDAASLAAWRRGIDEVARRPNTSVKISALGTTDHAWTSESIAPIVRGTIDAFGPDRVMFASNFPVDGMYSTMTALYEAFDHLTSDFSDAERRAMFGGTAARVYRIGPAA